VITTSTTQESAKQIEENLIGGQEGGGRGASTPT